MDENCNASSIVSIKNSNSMIGIENSSYIIFVRSLSLPLRDSNVHLVHHEILLLFS